MTEQTFLRRHGGLANGADPDARDNAGRSPYDKMFSVGQSDIAEHLRQAEAGRATQLAHFLNPARRVRLTPPRIRCRAGEGLPKGPGRA